MSLSFSVLTWFIFHLFTFLWFLPSSGYFFLPLCVSDLQFKGKECSEFWNLLRSFLIASLVPRVHVWFLVKLLCNVGVWTGVHVHDCTACFGFSEEEPAVLGSLYFSFWVLFFWCQEMTQWMVFPLKFGILSWNKSSKCNRLSHLRTVACLSPSLHM